MYPYGEQVREIRRTLMGNLMPPSTQCWITLDEVSGLGWRKPSNVYTYIYRDIYTYIFFDVGHRALWSALNESSSIHGTF